MFHSCGQLLVLDPQVKQLNSRQYCYYAQCSAAHYLLYKPVLKPEHSITSGFVYIVFEQVGEDMVNVKISDTLLDDVDDDDDDTAVKC